MIKSEREKGKNEFLHSYLSLLLWLFGEINYECYRRLVHDPDGVLDGRVSWSFVGAEIGDGEESHESEKA
jgi:hypothetical protein